MSNSILNFHLLSESLQNLLAYSTERMNDIPREFTAFEHKFGTFTNKIPEHAFLETLHNLDVFTAELGLLGGQLASQSGRTVNKSITTLVVDDNDSSIAASLVRAAAKTAAVAGKIRDGLLQLTTIFATEFAYPFERVARTRELLAGPQGLAQLAQQLAAELTDLKQRLEAMYPAAQRIIARLTSIGTRNLVNEANQQIGRITAQLPGIQQKIAELNGSILPFGKKKRRENIAQLERIIANKQEAIQKYTAFAALLSTAFFLHSNTVLTTLQTLIRCINHAIRELSATTAQFNSVAGNDRFASFAQLGNVNWLTRALDLPHSIAKWEATAAAGNQ